MQRSKNDRYSITSSARLTLSDQLGGYRVEANDEYN
jgi:hypothetical protein